VTETLKITSLIERRLIIVTGKGGVGKSTVSLALGMLAARRGLRTIIAELGGAEHAISSFGRHGAPEQEVKLAERLFAISIDSSHAMSEYLHQRTGRLGDLLASSGAFQAFAAATPGMRELLCIGKVWELAQPRRRVAGAQGYDLVLLDAPASGHALGALGAPRMFAEIAQVGPIARQARTIDMTLRDSDQTAVVAVALAEEIPVNETVTLARALRADDGPQLAGVIVNARYPQRFGPRQLQALHRARTGVCTPRAGAALDAACSEHARAELQREQLARLRAELDCATLTLPHLFRRAFDRDAVGELADLLERAL
jgi:Anion-transporting ATPase